MSTSKSMIAARTPRGAGVWACGDRRTVERMQYQRAERGPDGEQRVAVVTVERVRVRGRDKGFVPQGAENMPRVASLLLAEKYSGGREYFEVSYSWSVAGDVLPITGPMRTHFKARGVWAWLAAHKYVKVSTARVVAGAWRHENHVDPERTPIAQLRAPSARRRVLRTPAPARRRRVRR